MKKYLKIVKILALILGVFSMTLLGLKLAGVEGVLSEYSWFQLSVPMIIGLIWVVFSEMLYVYVSVHVMEELVIQLYAEYLDRNSPLQPVILTENNEGVQ